MNPQAPLAIFVLSIVLLAFLIPISLQSTAMKDSIYTIERFDNLNNGYLILEEEQCTLFNGARNSWAPAGFRPLSTISDSEEFADRIIKQLEKSIKIKTL